MTKKNGKIELLRFIFSLCILFHHITIDIGIKTPKGRPNFFSKGSLAVEFFFLISGFLMARSIEKQTRHEALSGKTPLPLWRSTVDFLWRKVKGILPYHFICCALMAVLMFCASGFSFAVIYKRLPSLFLLQRTGLSGSNPDFLSVEWYVSSMLLAMWILYPIVRKLGQNYTCLIGPILSVLIMGWMVHTHERITLPREWAGLTSMANLRAFAELSLGMCCYEVCKVIDRTDFTPLKGYLLRATEAGCYLYTFWFMCSHEKRIYEIYVLAALTVAVTISFSSKGILAGSSLLQNRVCCFLGSISLPLYLFQCFPRRLNAMFFSELRTRWQVMFIIVFSVMGAVGLYLFWNGVVRYRSKGLNEE